MKTLEGLDCVIVGAGAAGIGLGVVLKDLGLTNFVILERSEIGASFALWPKEMRFITPSFTSNAYGMMDLNAIALHTSPAYSIGMEHPDGESYADYLEAVAKLKELPVQLGVDVLSVDKTEAGFTLETSKGTLFSKIVIWAAGEFQYPDLQPFSGAEHCIHNSLVEQWSDIEGEDIVIVGGYESGVDAAVNLVKAGKRVTIIDRNTDRDQRGSSDPSLEWSPYTKERYKEIAATGRLQMIHGFEVQEVTITENAYMLFCENAAGEIRIIRTEAPPILATGFKGSSQMIKHLFEHGTEGEVLLSHQDESTISPGLFVSGSTVSHGHLLFCFIYKFRQRFAVVAGAIADVLELDKKPLDEYKKEGMYLEDLSCCEEDCVC